MTTDANERLLVDAEPVRHSHSSTAARGTTNPISAHHSSTVVSQQTASQGEATQTAQNARAKWVSTIITSTANFSVQYNFSAISIALVVMSVVECTGSSALDCKQGHQATWVGGTATATVFAGAIAGQLGMGYAGDVLGRNAAMTITLLIAAVAAALSALLPPHPSLTGAESGANDSATTVYAVIIACRFVLGVGLGGIFPLSAIKAAEDAGADVLGGGDDVSASTNNNTPPHRQQEKEEEEEAEEYEADPEEKVDTVSAAKALFWQCPGAIAPWGVSWLLTYTDTSVSQRWRLILGLGAMPSALGVVCSMYENYLLYGYWCVAKPNSDRDSGVSFSDKGEFGDGTGDGGEVDNAVNGMHAAGSNSISSGGRGGRGRGRGGRGEKGEEAPLISPAATDSNHIPVSVRLLSSSGSGSRVFKNGNKRLKNKNSNGTTQLGRSGSRGDGSERLSVWQSIKQGNNALRLFVTGGSWFLYDICYFGVALFGAQILDAVYPKDDTNDINDDVTSDNNIRTTTWHEMLVLFMAVPGTLVSIWLMKRMSTRNLQMYGFLGIAACFVLLATLMEPLKNDHPNWLYAIYCLLLFALCLGPNTTCFVLPGESYPKHIRATFNGMSAALGKLGAVVGAYTFGYLSEITSLYFVFCCSAGFAVAGAILTYMFLPAEGFMPRLQGNTAKDKAVAAEVHEGKGVITTV